MLKSDPITRLTPAEKLLVQLLDATSSREQVLAELKTNLQTAIEIELATIPIYLYTYYSIDRNVTSGQNIGPAELFANKAGGVIMSVAVEEMLHMSLSSNVLFALGVAPQIYGKAPPHYPTGLPCHNPKGPPGPNGATAVSIPLAKLGFEQLWHFLQIEYPERFLTWPEDRNWNTIGQFYSYIRCLISTDFVTDADFQHGAAASAIQPYNYSPNNVDTVYPSGKFDPWKPAPPEPTPSWAQPDIYATAAKVAVYPDAVDSHAGPAQLLAIRSKRDALEAIDTICDQGEGTAVQWKGPAPVDDPSKREQSHYYKFLSLQAQFENYKHGKETLPQEPPAPTPILPTVTQAELAKVVIDFPDNPTVAGYPAEFQPIARFSNALFQYMLIMTETIYLVPPANQKLFFNEGLHRSMIWVMDKYIRTIRQIPLLGGSVPGKFLAPTFEFVDLGPQATSFAALTQLGDEAITAANAIIAQAPNGSLASIMGNVIYYVGVATTATDGADHSKHLPDVGQYWKSPPVAGKPVPTPYPFKDAPAFPTSIAAGPMGLPLHACMGLNSCESSDRFGLDGPADGSGPNACAGQGYCSTAVDHTCHVQNDCHSQGGCGLYGTGREMNHPGANSCRSLGSCATPINAERFSTNGPNQGKSVWLRAREVFKNEVWPELRKELLARKQLRDVPADQPLPEQLGPVPSLFAETGPTYLWLSDDNKDRGNMTACGASGMSGAGGCS